MRNLLVHEWKGLTLFVGLGIATGLFLEAAFHPPWNERVLDSIAEHPKTVRPAAVTPAIAQSEQARP